MFLLFFKLLRDFEHKLKLDFDIFKGKNTRNRLTFERKIQLIEDSMKSGFKRAQAMVDYGVSAPFVSRLLKNKDKVLELSKQGSFDTNRKNLNFGRNGLLEEILYDWYVVQVKANVLVTGPMLKSKAEELSNSSTDECHFSNGWLEGFKKRHNIVLKSPQSYSRADSQNNALLEQILYQWVCHQQQSNVMLTGPMLKSKAEELSKACATTSEGFKFSTGWLDGFKKRHGIRFRSPDLSPSTSRSESDPLRSGPTLVLPPPPPHLMDIPDQKPPPFLQYFPYK